MADEPLLAAAARIADGEHVDWGTITDTLPSEEDRALADELALVARIAAGHRELHQLLPADGDTPSNLVPDRARWGHLDLLNIVGRGSYGTVYRAWDTRLERLVALKLFHGASNPEAVMQEGRMLARMRHENVVTVYGADVSDGVAGIWMELVHGRTLDTMVKKDGPMSARDAAAVGVDIARALDAVHEAGLVHCDVKAQNVVRETTGRVVLMDLGAGRLAPEYRDADDVSDVAGTPRYMAPELFQAGSTATEATDIYSFGVLLYFIASGRFPVEGKTLGELKAAHEFGRITPLRQARKDLPAAFVDVVSRAIDPDPAKRPKSATAIEEALEAVTERATARPTLSPRKAWLAAAVAAVVIAAAVWLFRDSLSFATLPPPNTLAVMPIRNLTGDLSKQYLADGLTEVLTAHLARVPGLEVASSASLAALRGTTDDQRALAEKLGVRFILAGALMQADDTIRLSVTLDDPYSRRAIWGSELQRRAATLLSARSEIANLVAARMSLAAPASLNAVDSRQPGGEAQDAFLRGLAELGAAPAHRIPAAVAFFEKAAALEPNWAEPLAYLAYTGQIGGEFGNPETRDDRAETIRKQALRAIELDPAHPVSYTALAAVQAYHDWDFRAAEATLRDAIAVFPRSAMAHSRLALLAAAQGQHEAALTAAERARELEPLIPEHHTTVGIIRYYGRDFDGALADMQRGLSIVPNYAPALFGMGRVLMAMGRHDEAIRSIQAAIAMSEPFENPGWLANLAVAYSLAGRTADAATVLGQLEALRRRGTFVSVDNFAYIAANQGRLDEAFALLNQAVDRRMTSVLWLAVDPRADKLRDDPRWERVIARMGVATK